MKKSLAAIVLSIGISLGVAAQDVPKELKKYVYQVPSPDVPVFMDSYREARKIEYILDEGHNKGNDYWQTPVETKTRGKGDCEDIGILLFQILQDKGISTRAVSGFGNIYQFESHFWLELEHGGETLILDAAYGLILNKKALEKQDPRYLYIEIKDVTQKVQKILKKSRQ